MSAESIIKKSLQLWSESFTKSFIKGDSNMGTNHKGYFSCCMQLIFRKIV